MRTIRLLLTCLLVCVLSCSKDKQTVFRIGVDPSWYPLNLEAFQPYVNGFTEELLLEMSEYSGASFLKMEANWDSLLEGLQQKRYDGILTSLAPLSTHKAKYDFSSDYLSLGPVLVVAAQAPWSELSHMGGEVVGVIAADPALLIVQKYPELVIRKYESAAELLQALFSGVIQGAVLDRLTAMSFIRNFYPGQLKIAGQPLADFGLHLVCLKGSQPRLLDIFQQSLERLQRQKKLQSLQDKWHL